AAAREFYLQLRSPGRHRRILPNSSKAPGDTPELYWVWWLSLPLPRLELAVLFRGEGYRGCHHAHRIDCDGVTLFGSRWIDRPDRGCENSYKGDTYEDTHGRSPSTARGALCSRYSSKLADSPVVA